MSNAGVRPTTLSSRRYRGHRNRSQARNSTGKPRRSDAVTHHELAGGSLTVPPNPPNVTYQPWNHLTAVHVGKSSTTGELTVNVQDLIDQIAKQIDPIKTGMATAPVINLKIQRIRAWNLTGHMIALSVDDFSDAAKAIADVDALCGLVDTGAANHTPAVGYDLPSSHRNIVLRNGSSSASDKKAVIYHVMAPASDTIIVYTTVLWKFDGPSKLSAFNSAIQQAINSIAENTADTAADVKELLETTDRIEKRGTTLGIGNAIVHGISQAAPYVLPLVPALETKLERIITALDNLRTNEVPDVSVKEWLKSVTDESFEQV